MYRKKYKNIISIFDHPQSNAVSNRDKKQNHNESQQVLDSLVENYGRIISTNSGWIVLH